MSRVLKIVRWTHADDSRLRKLSETRLSLQEIAEALGRTRNAVARRRNVLRIFRPCIVDQRIADDIANRYEAGMTSGAIGRVLGLDPRVVTYVVRMSGAVYPPTTLRLFKSKPCDGPLLHLRSEGVGVKDIGRRLGMSHRSVAERLTTLGRYADALEMTADRRRAA